MPETAELKNLMRFMARDAVFIHPVNPETVFQDRLVEVNDVACDLLGYEREELIGLPIQSVFQHTTPAPERVKQFLDEGFVRIERMLMAKDGSHIPVEIDAHSMTIDGQLMSLTVCRDISERQRIQQEKVLNTQRFRALYQLSQMIDEPEQAILDYALEEGVRMTQSAIGYIYLVNEDETELTLHAWSKNVMNHCSVADYPVVFKVAETGLWGEAVRQRKPIITNDYATCADARGLPQGHVPVTRHMNLPIMDDGRITLLAGVGNKKNPYSQSDVVQLSLIMEGVWRIIQRKRMEHDLIRAKQKAERANEIKSHFLANMSHELRTPLNGILGMTQILLNTDLTQTQKEYLTLSFEATRHLNKVVNDLLSLSSIEAGGIDLNPTDFNLHSTLETLTKPLSIEAAGKSLLLTLDIAPDIPGNLHGDVGKLRQILVNLLFNAIKFTREGQISLVVRAHNDDCDPCDTQCMIDFAVHDTGVGVPEDQHEVIFESFTLGEDYMTKQFGGSGLGLSICRQLAEIMGGRISMQSQTGQGSTFTLSVPLALCPVPANQCDAEAICAPINVPLHILLAEDEQVNSIMASRLLKKAGHEVTIVGNGQEAIEKLGSQSFDLVLMDVQMPVVNGIQATRIIRSGGVENVSPDLPIVGLTAFARNSEKKQFLEAGMHHVVTKPYEAEELLQAVTMAIQTAN